MHLKEFIEKAIEGGWNKYEPTSGVKNISFDGKDKTFMICDKDNYKCTDPYSYAELVLDPKAWEAVGKVIQNELREPYSVTFNKHEHIFHKEWAKTKMDGLMPHLQKGGTIESYIKTL